MHAYDAANRLASGPGVLATYVYDDLGRRVSVARGNGTSTAYAYDAAQRLLTLSHDLAGTAQDQSYRLTYNAVGQNLQRVGSNAAYAWPAPTLGTTPYARNGLDQYTSVGAANPTYDARGNLTGDGVAAYGYDALNRLTAAPGGASLAYDPMDRLYQLSVAGTGTRFVYDGAEVIGEYDAGGALLRRYVPGPALDEPIVWYEGSGTSDRRWLLADPLGSVVAVTNAAGAASNINSYDEYGVPGASNAGRFQYAGALALPEAGLLSLRARAYDPALGRFLQTDPILTEGGINLYAYVGNDPINATDPSGLGDPFLDEIIVHGYRWYEDPDYQSRQNQLGAQRWTREMQRVGGSDSGEIGDPAEDDPNSDEITVIGRRPDRGGFIRVQAGGGLSELFRCPVLEGEISLGDQLGLELRAGPASLAARGDIASFRVSGGYNANSGRFVHQDRVTQGITVEGSLAAGPYSISRGGFLGRDQTIGSPQVNSPSFTPASPFFGFGVGAAFVFGIEGRVGYEFPGEGNPCSGG